MNFEPITQIKIGLCFGKNTVPVGRLAKRGHKIYFEYDPSFIDQGLEISPIKCPLKPGVQLFDPFLFEGLPGVFNDSLPDGWGRLLLERKMHSMGIIPRQKSPLDQLSYVGHTGIGALVYEPDHADKIDGESINLDTLATHIEHVLEGEATDVLQELWVLNGSFAGARPKAMIGVHDSKRGDIIHGIHQLPTGYQPWLVKFPNTHDGQDAGAIEYVYALMAGAASLEIEEIMLFPAQNGARYFATRRFDRRDGMRVHSHTACGLLHVDFRIPSLDYKDLIALTMILTKDIREVEKMYRLAVFNVLSHNRDDHAKNFSFLMDRAGEWKLSPAYDLTFSSGPRGEQSTMVMGQGQNPSISDLVKLGLEVNLPKQTINDILDQTKTALTKWKSLAKEHGVSQANIDLIAEKIAAIDA